MSYNTLEVSYEGPTMIIKINRPQVLNALNSEVILELDRAIDDLIDKDELKGAILTGAGEKAFVAGADIAEVNQTPAGEGALMSARGQVVFAKFEQCPKPVIAAVNGFALGGGCELAMACHMRVASEKARFGQPEVNLGLIAGYGGTQRLVRLIGRGKATELLLTGEMIKAPEALQLGLVNHVVSAEEVMTKCHAILNTIYEKSPLAVALTLKAIDAGVLDTAHGFEVEQDAFGMAVESHDGREGTLAFIEKRKANFTGN
jgi:enoyl-CoA hydratase